MVKVAQDYSFFMIAHRMRFMQVPFSLIRKRQWFLSTEIINQHDSELNHREYCSIIVNFIEVRIN